METHYLDSKEKIHLPSERSVLRYPSISAIAALDATLAITRTAIICDNPSLQELMDMVEDKEKVPSHLFSAHNIADCIDHLRLTIYTYYKQSEEHLQHIKTKNLHF